MIAQLLGSEPGRVELTVQAPVSGVGREREREASGVPRPSATALVQTQVPVVFVQLVPGVLLPTPTPAQW